MRLSSSYPSPHFYYLRQENLEQVGALGPGEVQCVDYHWPEAGVWAALVLRILVPLHLHVVDRIFHKLGILKRYFAAANDVTWVGGVLLLSAIVLWLGGLLHTRIQN